MVGALAALDGWSGLRLASARAAAERTAVDTRACREIADRIHLLQRQPVIAGVQGVGGAEMAGRIEKAARLSGMAADSVMRIAPDSPRRLGDSPYIEQPTQVLLRHVTLPQMAVFLHTAIDDSGVEVRSVQLSAPHEQETSAFWGADVTLSCLQYSPKTKVQGAP